MATNGYTFEFGKYKGQRVENVPDDYIQWLIDTRKKDISIFQGELDRRDMVALASGTWIEKLVKTGYRELMKRHHPDAGGTDADAKQINAAFERLKEFK